MVSNKKKLIFAIFIAIVALVLATSTTYAWLSMDTSPEVWQFDIKVTVGESLSIAATSVGAPKPGPSSFRSFVSQSDINLVGKFFDYENNIAWGADALTTSTTRDTMQFSPKQPEDLLSANESAYYAFDLHFKGTFPYNIRLDSEVTKVSNTPNTSPKLAYFWQGNAYGGEVDTLIPAEAKDALRIAFGDKIFEPNADKGWGNFGGEQNIALDYYFEQHGKRLYPPPAPNVFTTNELNGFTHNLLSLEQTSGDNFEGKMTVKVWLEGWDADAFDAIKSQVLSIALRFEGSLESDLLALESIQDKSYDGTSYNGASMISLADSPSGGTITYAYKPQGSKNEYEQSEPVESGLYTVSITRAAYTNTESGISYPLCTIYANFAII